MKIIYQSPRRVDPPIRIHTLSLSDSQSPSRSRSEHDPITNPDLDHHIPTTQKPQPRV